MDYAERRVSLKHTTTTCVMLLLAARDGIFPRIDSPSTLCLCLGFMPDTLARAHTHTHTLTHFMDVLTTPISHFILSAPYPGPLMCFFFPPRLPECIGGEVTSCSLLSSGANWMLRIVRTSSFHSRERSLSVAGVFLSHSTNRKMFCAQQSGRVNKC